MRCKPIEEIERMKRDIKIYYMTQKVEVDSNIFWNSPKLINSPYANDTDYLPLIDETMNFHQLNLLKSDHIAEQLVPFTVYYYSQNSLDISDSMLYMNDFFSFGHRHHKFMSYRW